MAKIGSRRTGGAGIDLSEVTGFLRFQTGQDPTVTDFASQAQAEAGLDNTTVMTPLRVKQAIDELASVANTVGYALGKSSAPTENDNALANNDQSRPFAVRDLWQHVKVNPPVTEEDVDWYRLEAYRDVNAANGSPAAIWAPAEQVDAAVLTPITQNISTLQTSVSTLQTQMAIERSRVFESSGLVTIGSGEVIVELPSVPNDNSVRVVGQASNDQGLFPFIAGEDFSLFGSWLFFRNDSNGNTSVGNGGRSVDDGDKLDIDWFTNLANPPAVTGASYNGALAWNVAGNGHTLEIWRCPSGNDATLLANWSLLTSGVSDSGSYNPGASSGDKFAVRYVDGANRTGAWSDLITV